MYSLFIDSLLTINIIVSFLIILIVLMQRPKSEGLGAAFGGGMTENLFGAQTSNVLANFTRWLGGIFFFLTLLLSILYAKQSRQHSAIQAAAIKAAAAAAAEATPAASAVPHTSATPAASVAPHTSATPTASVTPHAAAAASAIPAAPAAGGSGH
ncbi:MAG: preprotein translocase subunit SecG [Chthoniobacteraceae bacterium]|jgi:preprotein translocase subunit SecG